MQVFRGSIYLTDGTVIRNITLAVFGNAATLDEWCDEVIPGYDGWGMTRIL